MKNIKNSHNKKNNVTVLVANIVELGKASSLTLGGGSGGTETRNQPFGLLHRTEK